MKNTRQSLSNSLLKINKVIIIKKNKVKKYPKNSKRTISKSKAVCKESSKEYKIEKNKKEGKLTDSLEMTQINRKLNKVGLKFPVKPGRKSKLPDRKNLTNSTNSKKQVHRRKSVQYASFYGISFLEMEGLSDGYALRSRISDFVRVTRSNSSFLTPTAHKPLQKKQCSQKHLGRRNSTRISLEHKQQRSVNRKMSFSSPVLQNKQNRKANENAKVSKSEDDSNLSNKEVKSTVSEGKDMKVQQNDPRRRSSSWNLSKKKENIERQLQNHSKIISVDDIVTSPASRPLTLRNSMKSFKPNSNVKSSRRKLNILDTEKASKIILHSNMRKKSEGGTLHLDNSTRRSSQRSGRKSLSPVKFGRAPLKNSKGATVTKTFCKVDCLTDDSLKIRTRRAKNTTDDSLKMHTRRAKNIIDDNINDENSPLHNKRQRKKSNDVKMKPTKTYQVDGSKGNKKTYVSREKNKCEDSLTAEPNLKQNKALRQSKRASIRYTNKSMEDKTSHKKRRLRSSTSNLQAKQSRTSSARKQKNQDSSLISFSPIQARAKRQTKPIVKSDIKYKKNENSSSTHKNERVKSLETPKIKNQSETQIPFHSTPYVRNVSGGKSLLSKASSLSTPDISRLPIDSLTTFNASSAFPYNNAVSSAYTMTPFFSKQKTCSLPITNRFVKNVAVEKRKAHSYTKETFSPDALKTKIPRKGTLKRKRWMLHALNEINVGYEDDIFDSNKFGPLKTFQFGDESDNSSVNIATPKFDCILTPALPKKTPRFKDCISPSELLLARKNAEEYLYRRNKKRKHVNEAATSSIKKKPSKKKNLNQDVPEKKKLDFEEAMNKLNAFKNNLEDDGDEEEDIYFSDVSD